MTTHRSCAQGPVAPALLPAGLLAWPADAGWRRFSGTGSLLRADLPRTDGGLPLQVQPLLTAYDFGWGCVCRLQARLVIQPGAGEGQGRFGVDTPVGSFAGEVAALVLPAGGFGAFELISIVGGGTGAFAGITGEGLSVLTLLGPPADFPLRFREVGRFRLADADARPWAPRRTPPMQPADR